MSSCSFLLFGPQGRCLSEMPVEDMLLFRQTIGNIGFAEEKISAFRHA